MAVPQYRDEVLITLTSRDPPSSFSFPDRRFFLTKEKPVMDIGRTSKRNSSFEAAKNNAWFDSPVMSRDHASLKLDFDKQKVYIKDVGSLHGTFKNNQQLARNSLCPLASGDIIQFGIPIERGSDKYPACIMEARVKFGSVNPEDRPKVFRVPDDSDVEESGSDDDHSIRISSEILRSAKVFPCLSPQQPTIDLTGADQYPTSNVRDENNYTTNTLPSVSPDAKHPHEVTYVDLSSPSPEDTTECNGFSPISPGPCWAPGYDEAVEEESDINLSESTDMDTASSPEADSVSQSSSPASVSGDVHHDYATEEAMDIEDEFDDQDEFDNGDDVSEPFEESIGQENLDSPEQFAPPQPISHFTHDMPTEMIQSVYETNTLESLSTECVRQNIPENGTSISPLVTYTFKPQLPPIEQPRMEPPWAHPTYAQPLRLPSIAETVPPYPPPQSPDSKALAEVLGARTGKYEFFAARVENKINALPCGVVPSDNSISISTAKPLEQNPPPTQMISQESNTEMPASEESATVPVEAKQLQTSTPKRLVPSEWTASGEQFLNTPPKEAQETEQMEAPILDETSAYQFELSKKAASNGQCDDIPVDSQAEPAKKTHMEISDIVEGSNDVAEPSTPSRPPKRKAEEICQLTPEEEAKEEAKKDDQQTLILDKKRRSYKAQQAFRRSLGEKKKQAPQAPVADMIVPPASASTSQPPAKRLRRVAEVLSYAALGGVAVMSALIATAPTL